MDLNVSRRKFLKLFGVTIGGAALGSILLPNSKGIEQETALSKIGEGGTKYAMAVDLKKCETSPLCDGTYPCVYACKAVNLTPANSYWLYVVESEEISYAKRLPRLCMHCDNPPCVKVCPVGATYKRIDGLVLVDYARCIGCRLCAVACPYGARYFNWRWPEKEQIEKSQREAWEKVEEAWKQIGKEIPLKPDAIELPRSAGVIEKCTFCVRRIENGLKPACVVACPDALYFGDLSDPESEISKLLKERKWLRLLEELGTEPRVFYLV